MKIGDANRIYRAYRQELLNQKSVLVKQREELNKKAGIPGIQQDTFAQQAATLELSIADIDSKFEKNQELLDRLSEQYASVWNAEVAKQQGEAMEDYAEDMAKIMEVARRISKGGTVPPSDEKKLMEYSMELYLAAKNMAMMSKLEDREEYDSLWEEEEEETEYDPQGKAENAEVNFDLPEIELPEASAGEAVIE